jgi:hypothetical protein
MRRQDPSANILAPHDLERKDFGELATVVLTRPMRMIIFEPIVNTTCVYLSLVYAIFYMTFQAYPLIFEKLYGLSPGVCGLTYLAIGGGALLGLPVFWGYVWILRRGQERDAPWAHREEYRRVPLACVGGPIFVISLFWLGWTAREDTSFVVPMLAGLFFGLGFECIFMALLNYLSDSYDVYAGK